MGPHAVRAVGDGHFERPAGAPVDVLFGKAALGFGDPPHGLGEAAGPTGTSLVEAGLVEVDVGIDEAGQHQPAAEIDLGRIASEIAPDRGEPRAGDADIERAAPIAEIGAADHCVERHGVILAPLRDRATRSEPFHLLVLARSMGRAEPEPASLTMRVVEMISASTAS